jgi:hypothetical protein
MRAVTLPYRAFELLMLVDHGTKWEGDERPGSVLLSFYNPKSSDYLPEVITCPDGVKRTMHQRYGSGDASALRGLAKKGLIKKQEGFQSAWAITEEGMLAIQDVFFPCQCTKAECLNPPKYRRQP